MDQALHREVVCQRQDRLLKTLERLLELPTTDVNSTLNQAAQLVAEVLAAEKVDAFLHNSVTDTLVAVGTNDTPMGKRQQAVGMDRVFLINMVDLVQEVVPAFSGPDTPIHVHAPQEMVLSADPNRLRQVLENLLTNAVEYAPKHIPIKVQLDKVRRIDGPWMLLTVSNAGPGLPPERCVQLLRPFVAGVTSTGLGLGLYLANRIAAAHYGTLTVDSPRGHGVQVTLALPMEDEDLFIGRRNA